MMGGCNLANIMMMFTTVTRQHCHRKYLTNRSHNRGTTANVPDKHRRKQVLNPFGTPCTSTRAQAQNLKHAPVATPHHAQLAVSLLMLHLHHISRFTQRLAQSTFLSNRVTTMNVCHAPHTRMLVQPPMGPHLPASTTVTTPCFRMTVAGFNCSGEAAARCLMLLRHSASTDCRGLRSVSPAEQQTSQPLQRPALTQQQLCR